MSKRDIKRYIPKNADYCLAMQYVKNKTTMEDIISFCGDDLRKLEVKPEEKYVRLIIKSNLPPNYTTILNLMDGDYIVRVKKENTVVNGSKNGYIISYDKEDFERNWIEQEV